MLMPMVEEQHLLVRLKDKGTLKKTIEKSNKKKAVEPATMTLSESLSEYDDAFDVDYSTPAKRVHKEAQGKEEASPHEMRLTTIMSSMIERLKRVKKKVDRVDERLNLLGRVMRCYQGNFGENG